MEFQADAAHVAGVFRDNNLDEWALGMRQQGPPDAGFAPSARRADAAA